MKFVILGFEFTVHKNLLYTFFVFFTHIIITILRLRSIDNIVEILSTWHKVMHRYFIILIIIDIVSKQKRTSARKNNFPHHGKKERWNCAPANQLNEKKKQLIHWLVKITE